MSETCRKGCDCETWVPLKPRNHRPPSQPRKEAEEKALALRGLEIRKVGK